MKKKFLLAVALLSCLPGFVQAQVENRALQLDAQGSVDCGPMSRLDDLSSFSVQFWMNPSEWTKGAVLFSRGDGFSVALGDEGTVVFTAGGKSLAATSAVLQASKWNQLTLISNETAASVMVNGETVASGSLAAIPASASPFVFGGSGYKGRIDDVRLWACALNDDFNYFISNTINKWCPQYSDLIAYYKFDQPTCPNVVEYKTIWDGGMAEVNNHGVFSSEGASRVSAADNEGLPYLINGAYTANERFFDRGIPREQYLLSNDLIILGIASYSDGHLKYVTPCNHAKVIDGTYLEEFEGREGVLQLNGESSKVECPVGTFAPEISDGRAVYGYTFETWLYIDEWNEGAFLFRKETDDAKNGFSIRLGKEDTKQLIVRVNGAEYVHENGLKVGEWMHFGISPNSSATIGMLALSFVFNGESSYPNPKLSSTEVVITPTGAEDCLAYIGEGFKGKLDETLVWDKTYSVGDIRGHMNNVPMPSIGGVVTADPMKYANAYYKYDEADNLGWSSHSQDEWLRIMRAAYDGYTGYQIRISVKSHTNWQNTISDAAKRKIFAADLAELSKPYDGVELDLEWIENSAYWPAYGALSDEIRAALPEDKTFFVSCHSYAPAYQFPTDKMANVNGFTFQIYGPQNGWSHYSTFERVAKMFSDYGFPKEKMMLSYATTTSRGYTNGSMVSPISGVRSNGFLDEGYVPNDEVDSKDVNGVTYYFTGPTQTYKRAKYCMDNKLQGIFYWDMGNDVPVEHQYNLAKWCSYGLNANVDPLVETVAVKHSGVEAVNASDGRESADLRVYPTPAGNELNMMFASGTCPEKAQVYSLSGSCVAEQPVIGGKMDVSMLQPGFYVVIAQGNGETAQARFMKY